MPLVSVVLPTFNRSSLLCETIESILQQTFEDFELIVVDNMSEDNPEKCVNAFQDKRINFFRNPNYGVISINRNYGISKAKGIYIAFCDDDDLWEKNKLKKQIELLMADPDAGLCHTNGSSFCEDKIIEEKLLKSNVRENWFHELLRTNFILSSSVVIKASILPHTNLFNENKSIVTVEDYEMWLRIAHKYPLVYIDEQLIKYRVHRDGNLSRRKRSFFLQIELLKLIRKECDLRLLYYYKVMFRQWIQYIWRTLRLFKS